MSWKNSVYILLVIAVAGISALTGALAGGAVGCLHHQSGREQPC
jgi:ABC-type branched-subunit amino acid transport system permease subunit